MGIYKQAFILFSILSTCLSAPPNLTNNANVDDSSTTTPSSSSEEVSTTTTNTTPYASTEDDEGVVVVVFPKDGTTSSSDLDSSSPQSTSTPTAINKRDVDAVRKQHQSSTEDGDQGLIDSSENSNSTSAKQIGNSSSTFTDIILVPLSYQQRPVLIDVIFFKLNRTGLNGTDDSSSRKIIHPLPINSDEDNGLFTTTTSTSADTSTTLGQDSHHRMKREDTTTPSSSHGNAKNKKTSGNGGDNSNGDDTTTTKGATFSSSEEEKHDSGDDNKPQFTHKQNDHNKMNGDKKNSTDNDTSVETDSSPTTTENNVFSVFFEIIEYGQNVTKALFGKMDREEQDGNDGTIHANSTARNRSVSSGTDIPIHRKIIVGTTDDSSSEGTTTLTVSSSTQKPHSHPRTNPSRHQEVEVGSDS